MPRQPPIIVEMPHADEVDTDSAHVTVSVITPCYNGGRFLRQTLQSALDQTRTPLEIIVIDDGSTDDSAKIAESFGAPVRVIRQANQGESVARNRGIAEARGTHLLFLDADDLLDRNALETLGTAVQGLPGAVALMGCQWFRDEAENPYSVEPARHHAFYPEIMEGNFGPPNCWLVPRSIVLAAGGFCETMRWFEDWDLWWRVGLKASALIPVDYAGAKYRQHANSQLATTKPRDRAFGHATLVARMAREVMTHGDVLNAHGDRLYWSVWSALKHAREKGVSWQELSSLGQHLVALSTNGPDSVRRLRSARLVRLFGLRAALLLQPSGRATSPAA